ncbi:MAG: bifunctional hydroxymethylpyrimidine kinase/phosphomethylpyrimidine kinase [Dethiosulfovibrio peptidovorans]|nr:MAG: bifunctional hydroxymethylpyrimidine kinase/phosphomethylpyrimidine kinase [Dethiosulfovibrio peptidovorans]
MTVAGSDSGGGAGIQADLKTFAALRVFGTSAVAAVTAQNSLGVQAIHNIPPGMVLEQMRSVLSDFSVGAVKTGMLSGAQIVTSVCEGIRELSVHSLVVDPVMVAQSGDPLIADQAVMAIKEELLPLASLVTPNVPEAERLSGLSVTDVDSMTAAASTIAGMGPQAVLVKGGHLEGNVVTDVLWISGKAVRFDSPKIDTGNTHGTGCTLSAAIAAELAAGCELQEAVKRGHSYLQLALKHGFRPGGGHGPVGHLVSPEWIQRGD